MGWRFRKSKNFGPFRLNFSKSGIGWSVGGKGFRYTKKANGGTRETFSIPGTGVSYVKETGRNGQVPLSGYTAKGNRSVPPQRPPKTTGRTIALVVSIILIAIAFLLLIAGVATSDLLFGVGLAMMPLAIAYVPLNIYAGLTKGIHTAAVCSLLFFFGVLFMVVGAPDSNTNDANNSYISSSAATSSMAKNVTSNTTQSSDKTTKLPTSSTKAPTTSTDAPTTSTEKQSETVWIPSSGQKYHSRSDCSNMSNPQQITLEEAESLGYSACKRCH